MTQEKMEKLLDFTRNLAWDINNERRKNDTEKAEQLFDYLKDLGHIFPEVIDVNEYQSENKPYAVVYVNGGEEAINL